MGGVATVDVAGRHLGRHHVVLGHRLGGTVVAEPAHPLDGPGPIGVEGDELAAALAVEAHVARGLLDDAVGLAGDDVAVLAEPDVDALAAAVEGEQEPAGLVGGGDADGDRALERRHRAAEGLDEVGTPLAVAGDDGRDDLGVGRDRAGEAQPVGDLEVGVVVDVAVEHADEEPGLGLLGPGRLGQVARHRVGVGLGDDPDAGPAGVAEHGDPGARRGQRPAQEGVVHQPLAHHPGVVAELADLGRRLVDDRQAAVDETGGAALVERIGRTGGEGGGDGGVGRVEAVAPDEDVDPGRVAATDLHEVDRRQGLLDRQVSGVGGLAGAAAGQLGDGTGRAQAVAADGPQDVAQRDRRGAGPLQGVDVEVGPGQVGVDLGRVGVELVEAGRDRRWPGRGGRRGRARRARRAAGGRRRPRPPSPRPGHRGRRGRRRARRGSPRPPGPAGSRAG